MARSTNGGCWRLCGRSPTGARRGPRSRDPAGCSSTTGPPAGARTGTAGRQEREHLPRRRYARHPRCARADPRVFVYGEDVGGKYGNAFLLLRPLLAEFGDRILNSLLAEGAVLGVCIGAALAGSAADWRDAVQRFRRQRVQPAGQQRRQDPLSLGRGVPMVVRMPWGGLRHAGPYHSQNTEPWFYRTPGLKIVAPSTPHDARALFASAVTDPDPVLYYEHIALYRDPRIKQSLPGSPAHVPIGRAALRRAGITSRSSLTAHTFTCAAGGRSLAADGIEASVLDLLILHRSIARGAAVARHCHRVLVVHEDSRTGGIGESVAAIIQEEAFECARRPSADPRRAGYAGAVLAAARGILPPQRGASGACCSSAGRILAAKVRRFPIK